MKNEKKHPRKQLEKYSNIFMQLSLVLVLFVVYQIIEFKSIQKDTAIHLPEYTDDYVYALDTNLLDFKKEEKKIQKPVKPKPVFMDLIEAKKDDDFLTKEILIDSQLADKIEERISSALNDYVPETPVLIDDVDFIIIEDAPIYKGCEGLSKEENKKCFIKSIQKFVVQKFNVDLAQDLGLRTGTYKIFTQFVIDKEGNIKDIKIKAPHPKLEKEVNRIVKKMPQFTPGMQRKVPVNVKFTLPVSFKVE